MSKRVLLIVDKYSKSETIVQELSSNGYKTDCVASVDASLEMARSTRYDLAIFNMSLKRTDGLALLKALRNREPDIPILFIKSKAERNLGLRSLRIIEGGEPVEINCRVAGDIFLKNGRSENNRAVERKALITNLTVNRDVIVICRSAVMKKIFSRIPEYAAAGVPLLISGEKGTGKEFITGIIAKDPCNPRTGKPFVSVNCEAVPDEYVESELLGSIGGITSGNMPYKKGLLEEADGGTLYFDEVSGASKGLQEKVMAIINKKEFRRLGRKKMYKADVRIIATSSRDLSEDVKEGHFRRDLFNKLIGVHIKIPPLRERREDILPLAEYFLDTANKKWSKNTAFADEAIAFLEAYNWPENVRQLKNVVHTAVAAAKGSSIRKADIAALVV